MKPTNPEFLSRRWTAGELRKLPDAQRDAILETQAAIAEEFYRNDPELTAFEAFGEEDLFVESSDEKYGEVRRADYDA